MKITIKTLLNKATIFAYYKKEKYFENNKYIENSLWSLSTEELNDPRLAWRKLADEISSTEHIFCEYNTEIQWIIHSYKKLVDSVKWPIKRKERWYYYSDIVAFYSILWNKIFNLKIKEKFNKNQKQYLILEKFRETRNRFFDHRISDIQWVDGSSTELDIQFDYQDHTLVLSPRFDYVQFINILKATK